MKQKAILLIAVFCLVAALIPTNLIAEEENNEITEVEEVVVVEETPLQEVVEESGVAVEVVAVSRNNARSAVVYPATIESIFPETGLAQTVATKIGKAVTDTVTAAELAAITTLSAQNKGIVNLTGIEELTGLTALYLSTNAITDISTVNWSAFPLLEALTLDGNKIADISGVDWTGLSNLKTLLITGNGLTNINCNWAPLTALERINFETNNIADISQVNWTGLSSLQTLMFNFNPITDISGVDWTGLSALQALEFRGCQLTKADSNYTPLGNLKRIEFTFNKITSLATVDWTGLVSLNALNMSMNEIETLEGVDWSKLPKLETLNLNNNKITDLGPANWTGLSLLKYFYASSNKISDLSKVDWAELTGLINFSFDSQVVELDPILFAKPIVLENIVKDHVRAAVDLTALSNGGTYDAATGKATWDLAAHTPTLTSNWTMPVTINGITKNFTGQLRLPLTPTYQVTFKDHDGSVLKQELLAQGVAIVAPTTPPRAGYVFAGWTPALHATMPGEEVEYTAIYNLVAVNPVPSKETAVGRTCQDDGYANGYYWNGSACVLAAGYTVPNTGVK